MRWLMCVLCCLTSTVWAGELTLPFQNQNTDLLQGWYYNDGSYHGGIDYGCGCGTTVVAPADGWATSWYQAYDPGGGGYSWGEYVLMYHPSCQCYTLSAHLSAWEPGIPRVLKTYYDGRNWVWIRRGASIGKAGKTGTSECHLHFEVARGGIPTSSNRVDPYGLYRTSQFYPGCNQGNGEYFWTQCPPVVAASVPTCTNPGSWVDLKTAGDFDGNGKKEFVRYYAGVGRWDVARSTGYQFLPLAQWMCGHGVGSSHQTVGDFNGDHKTDSLVYFNSTGHAYIAYSTGSIFGPTYLRATPSAYPNWTEVFAGDVNGDGRDDLVGYYSGIWITYLSNGWTFQYPILSLSNHGQYSQKRLVADVNGDRRVDAVAYHAATGRWDVALGQSNGRFAVQTTWANGHGQGSTNQFLADIDGNGRADAFCFWNMFGSTPGVWVVWNSFAGNNSFTREDAWRTSGQGYNSSNLIVADFTGDGGADLGMYFSGLGWYVAVTDGIWFRPGVPW